MTGWREHILADFSPGTVGLTLVADPDGLLLEAGMLERIQERGFALIPFESHVEFRFAFESSFRSKWDENLEKEQAVVVHVTQDDLQTLPYDLLQAGRRLHFSLAGIFPNFSYPVLAALDKSDLDALYLAQKDLASERLGDRSSKDFILRHVFSIAPELLKHTADLLRMLLRMHYRQIHLPSLFQEHLIQEIEKNGRFSDWPLGTIVPDREAFLAFLQERWEYFIQQKSSQQIASLQENRGVFNPVYPGPVDLPFEHHDVRVYLDTLFLDGLLEPVDHPQSQALSETWVSLGVRIDPEADRIKRLEKLYSSLRDDLPGHQARHGKWLTFARSWAELLALWLQTDKEPVPGIGDKIRAVQLKLDNTLAVWAENKLGGLINLPPVPPVMLHHIPRFLARSLEQTQGGKVALVVLDGLSFDQWVTMRKVLALNTDFLFRENAVFAWLPTTTSISRQALFAGRPPVFFPDSIHTTGKEAYLWRQFWADHGIKEQETVYARGLGDDITDELHLQLVSQQTRVAGLVVDKVDRIMHGMELGLAGMHNQIRQWAGQPFLGDLLDMLLQAGYQVFLTSDHGNIQAAGCGRPAEGALAATRGERVRIFRDPALRERVASSFPEAIAWSGSGLPEDVFPLIAPHRQAFVSNTRQLVCHGGISLEELVVPLVQIERKQT